MAEAVKQFFVGFIHPRTWLAVILGLVVATIGAVAVGGYLTDFFSTIISGIGGGALSTVTSYLSGVGFGSFSAMLFVYEYLIAGSAIPLVILLIGAIIAGLIFGLLSKKERVASKSIIGGLNIGLIYTLIVVVALVFWLNWSLSTFAGFTALYNAVVLLLQAAYLDVLVMFLIVWWVSAIVSILILSVKHD
jgi:hypothetical protein